MRVVLLNGQEIRGVDHSGKSSTYSRGIQVDGKIAQANLIHLLFSR